MIDGTVRLSFEKDLMVIMLKELNDELSRYPDLDVKSRHILLKRLGQIANLNTFEKEVEIESICPYTKEALRVNCGLKSCPYWNQNEWTKNCSLNFLLKQQADALSIPQVSLLYGKSPERVESIYKKCFKIVQRHYLRSTLREKRVPRFHFLRGFCVACQTKLSEEELCDPNLHLTDGFGYCSADCKKQYPPNYFEIERFFEAEFLKIIEVGAEIFTFYYLEEILGFQPNVLRNRLEKIRDGKKVAR